VDCCRIFEQAAELKHDTGVSYAVNKCGLVGAVA
jgi:hypothetical protein